MKVITYLNFDGRCEEAFTAYAKTLGGKIEGLFRWGDSPVSDHAPADFGKKILHATLSIGDQILMGADCPSGSYNKPQGFGVSLNLADIAQSERIFDELSKGGTIQMPLQETFWANRFGMFTDRFGTPWMVNCEKSV